MCNRFCRIFLKEEKYMSENQMEGGEGEPNNPWAE